MTKIKNPHKRHWTKRTKFGRRYICITAVIPTPSKIAKTIDQVNCQNCIVRLPPLPEHLRIDTVTGHAPPLQAVEKKSWWEFWK